jgi:hypothetical protein
VSGDLTYKKNYGKIPPRIKMKARSENSAAAKRRGAHRNSQNADGENSAQSQI